MVGINQFGAKDLRETSASLDLRPALIQLGKAYEYAAETDSDLWEFAIEIDRLIALGLTTSDLRLMVKRGYVEHGREVTAAQDTARKFERDQNLAFAASTCFVLAELGIRLAMQETGSVDTIQSKRDLAVLANVDTEMNLACSRLTESVNPSESKTGVGPIWDSETRTLQVGAHVVKQYRVPSPNQESVLAAFQEEGWPSSIDDPLPPLPNQQPKRRLRDTIKCLNLNQISSLIRFHGDGTGQRVRWQLVADELPIKHELRRAA